MRGILRGLTENRAATDPTSPDRRLHGRTYAIPFEVVWRAATNIAAGELRGWSLLNADDQEGIIEASTTPLFFGRPGEVRVEIGLDENAQTRVDARSTTTGRRGDLGRSRRTIGRFFRELDSAVVVEPAQILDPTRSPAWLEPL